MTLQELMDELYELVRDECLRDAFFKKWINAAVLGIASDFDLPALELIEPYALPITSDNWLHNLPDSYHKKLFRAAAVDYADIGVLGTVAEVDRLDPDHDEVEDYVSFVAAHDERRKLAVFPKSTTSVRLWFYEKPEVLDLEDDPLTCIPDQYQRQVLLPRLIIDIYPSLQDMAVQAPGPSIAHWQRQYSRGLFGVPKGDVGMINYLAAQRPPKVHLGRQHL